MTSEERHTQLLETAWDIVRAEGTDHLTLGRLAERAGVSKPIAYEHFETRSGLLIAMYQDYDQQQTKAMREALAACNGQIQEVAAILSAAYVDCAVSNGPESGAITAALSATEEMETLLQSCRDSFISECREAFTPFTKLADPELQAILFGFIGAAEALSQMAATGRMSRDEATGALTRMMVGGLA